MTEIVEAQQELLSIVANCRDPELLNFAKHVREAGARLYARFPDASEIELCFPETLVTDSSEQTGGA